MAGLRAGWGLQIWALARHVWIEALRDRFTQALCLIGVILLASSMVLSRMAIGNHERVIQNMGFWVIWVSGFFGVLCLGSNLVRHEIQQRTIFLILSRPLGRNSFLLGKYCGMILVLATIFLILSTSFGSVMLLSGIRVNAQHAVAGLFIFSEWIILAAFSVLFAGFTSPPLHNFFLAGVAFLGHWCNDLLLFAQNTESHMIEIALRVLFLILPNLECINFRGAALYEDPIPGAMIAGGLFFTVAWIGALICASAAIFSSRKIF
ncbi:Type IV pilus biogenesis protein PilI-like protein [uncultured Desulfatiglans sp.]|nr:Type IV pilus biogenesis protein PilI-like protein [uncultured Desulfatiglans sp.]